MQSTGGSTAGLVKEATFELGKLVESELALAREELGRDAREARDAAVLAGAASLAVLVGAEIVVGALFSRGLRRIGFFLLGASVAATGIAVGRTAFEAFPDVLARTRRRAAKDIAAIEETLGEP